MKTVSKCQLRSDKPVLTVSSLETRKVIITFIVNELI